MERSGSSHRDLNNDLEHLTGVEFGSSGDLSRKRSLVRPDRQRVDRDHPQYHYQQLASQQAAAGIHVQPSTTGNEPIVQSPSMGRMQSFHNIRHAVLQEEDDFYRREPPSAEPTNGPVGGGRSPRLDLEKSARRESSVSGSDNDGGADSSETAIDDNADSPYQGYDVYNRDAYAGLNGREYDEMEPETSERAPIVGKDKGTSLWAVYCRILTFPVIPVMMRPFGMKTKERQMAWREKIGLISVILLVGTFVGYLTFGFTQTVCKNTIVRTHVGHIPDNAMVISGSIYDFGQYNHPDVGGYSGPVLYGETTIGGKDGSLMFQNVNGHCLDVIKPKAGTQIPNQNGKMGWYFPCQIINENGTLVPNEDLLLGENPIYNGWGCHTGAGARDVLYTRGNLSSTVYYNWDDLRLFPDRQLIVFNGDVLDLSYLDYLLKDDVDYPALFDELRNDNTIKGLDISPKFSYGEKRQAMQCLRELTKVGAIDTETIGCIASDVVLYVSLVFIVGLVVIKFAFACYFRFVIARKQGAFEVTNKEYTRHEENVENWTDDIYSAAPLSSHIGPAPSQTSGGARSSKRRSMLLDKLAPSDNSKVKAQRRVTMGLQNPSTSTSRIVPGGSIFNAPLFRQSMYSRPATQYSQFMDMDADTAYHGHELEAPGNGSRLSYGSSDMHAVHDQDNARPASIMMGPVGGDGEFFVPQPPVGYEPFGFPLAHTMCLVTAYSESVEGLRTTLDSIATTEYPNSHKLMVIICDGLVKGAGNDMSTPDICLSMMKEMPIPAEEVQAYSYVSVVSGAKRHNMAKVYAGFYKYDDSTVSPENQQRIPIITIVKTGTPEEAAEKKPGNRGKRDSQVILMTFLQRIMFDERMTELDFEIFNGIRSVTGVAADFYELVLMVDADTKVFPDSLTHMAAEMVKDPEIMGLCGETKIANKTESWVTAIQVFEYFISHHQAKAFESVFGGVTCLPGCFSMYRIKSPKGAEGYWVPILGNPDIVERYSENVVDTLHKKNLLLLGEDRYLSSLMLRTFPKRKMIFLPKAACKTVVPSEFRVLLSQRRRWINSTIHNLMELVLVRDLCGVFIISMQFVVFIDLISTLVLPAAISFTIYIVVKAIVSKPTPTMSLILLALILGLPGVLIVVTASRASYILWMAIYLLALPIWNFVLPMYAYWKFDDFSWGETRAVEGEEKNGHDAVVGEFNSSHIVMKRWRDFQRDRAHQSTIMM